MYNAGPQVTTWELLSASIAVGMPPKEILMNILDTANEGGKSVKGLARRRALSFNLAVDDDEKITKVKQEDDGTIYYYDKDGVLFSYKKAKHPASKTGTMKVS